jgi:uracil-DNA glycosylase
MLAVPSALVRLRTLHGELDGCRLCPKMIGPVVHGPPVLSKVMLVGQAPGPREGGFGRPFAWTAGRTLFRWFEESTGVNEEEFRARVYIAAVARCFPGKASGGGDRKPDFEEIAQCRTFLAGEVAILKPELVLAVGSLAINEVLGKEAAGKKLDALVGRAMRKTWHGVELDVIPLPHPSGASPWHKMEPGKALLGKALALVKRHPAMRAIVAALVALTVGFWAGPASAEPAVAASAEPLADVVTFPISIAVTLDDGKPVRDDAWIAQQIDDANDLYAKTRVRFRWTQRQEISPAHAQLHTRADRDALAPLVDKNVIDVFVVAALEDVDEPGRYRKGVAWTSKPSAKRFLILSAAAPRTVLAHELGHFFGNGHTDVPDNLMSYTRAGGRVFLDDAQIDRIHVFMDRFLASGRLFDVGPPRRWP